MGEDIKRTALVMVLTELAQQGERWVPFAVSARHVHLCQNAVAALFGRALTPRNPLSQPGQFACEERVDFRTSGGLIQGIRVLGPERPQTQLELSVSDCRKLGIAPPVRLSGQLAGSPGGVLVGPAGEFAIESGVILAQRHLHMSPAQAAAYGLKNGDTIAVEVEGERPGLMSGIPVRVGEGHTLDLHIDTDEANAWLLQNGDIARLAPAPDAPHSGFAAGRPKAPALESAYSLITEAEINQAEAAGQKSIACTPGGIVTPAAWDRAAVLDIEILLHA